MKKISLSGRWQYAVDGCLAAEKRGYFRKTFDRGAWRSIAVPSTFAAIDPVLALYDRAVCYARTVRVPAQWQGRRVVIRFEGANFHTKVWINGKLAGTNDDAFLPFEFPVHGLLKFGAENLIVVHVDAVHNSGELTGPRHTWQVGWRCDGGLLRDIALIAGDFLHIDRVQVAAEPEVGGGRLGLEAAICNERPVAVEMCVRALVRDGTGKPLATLTSAPCALDADQVVEVTLEGRVCGVRPWSPERPRLYALTVQCLVNGRVADKVNLRTGFRRVEVRGQQLFLNGRPIFLTGFNRHEDSPRTGQAVDRETTRNDLLEMKRAGCNFIRLCHYPHDSGELDLCDELGLLAMCEIPLYNWPGRCETNGLSNGSGKSSGKRSYAKKVGAAERSLRKMIARDRNHPAVIFWSVSNETAEEREEVVEANNWLLRLAKSLDPTRLVVHVSFGVTSRHHFDLDDVICINEYPGINGIMNGHDPAGDFAYATKRLRKVLQTLNAAYPGKPILVTEFGHPSLKGQHVGALSEETAARVIEAEFAGMDLPCVCGAIVWCWADHPWPVPHQGFWNLDFSPFGVHSRDRTKRLPFKTAARLFRGKQAQMKMLGRE